MICPEYIRSILSRARKTGGPLSLACLLLLCPAASYGQQQATTPRAPRPAQAPVAPAQTPAAPAQAPAMPAPAPPARTPVPRRPPMQAVVPREVVTVVHRLSGWKLLAWLATSGPPAVVLEELPSFSDTHTNIVAGYVYDDGRSVVARLPQAEVELEAFDVPATPPAFFAEAGSQFKPEPEYMLVTSAGKHVEAKLVGLDSSTGLALLEADQPLLPGAPVGEEGDTDDPTVGQRVRLYAPIPAEAPAAPVAQAAPPAPGSYISLSIDQKEGRLTRLIRTPSGRLSSVAVNAAVSPAWVGAVAANELGEIVGIVSQSREGETRVLPVAAIHEACERVLKLRGTVPQPWLGVRGDAVARAPLQFWFDMGWTPAAARPLIARREGVLLTSVAQGTPAALAGLRAGDLITSVGPRAVRSVEDLSMTLKEAGVGTVVDVTVLRATTPAPLKFAVELKGAKNPALATAEAERRAASTRVNALRREVGELQEELAGLTGYAASGEHLARAASIRARLDDLMPKLRSDWEVMKTAEERAAAASLFSLEPAPVIYGTQALKQNEGVVTRRLKGYGLHALGLSTRSAAPFGAQGGLLVVAVQPESPAAVSGLMPGDVIETVNGSPLWRFELRQLTSSPDAAPAVFGLVRGGKRLSVKFPPAPAPEPRR